MIDEDLFRQGVLCLRTAGIPFWVDAGTLLGMVREGRVIAWDQDYDFGVWSHQTTERAVVSAFDSRHFRARSLFAGGTKAVHVYPRKQIKGKIDITFYTRQGDRAIYRSHVAPDTARTRLLGSVERYLGSTSQRDTQSGYRLKRLVSRGMFAIVPRPLRRGLGRGFEYLVVQSRRNGACYVYDFPARHFEQFRSVSFLGVDVDIPKNAEEYLETAYGLDWQSPKQWTHWHEGATRIERAENGALQARASGIRESSRP